MATDPIWPLAWEPPYAMGENIKKKKKKKKKKKRFKEEHVTLNTKIFLKLKKEDFYSQSFKFCKSHLYHGLGKCAWIYQRL